MSNFPFLHGYVNKDVLAWKKQGGYITVEQFLQDVALLAKALPQTQYVINLCEDRYLFTVVFAAALVREQINLLPQSRAAKTVEQVLADYPKSFLIDDAYLNKCLAAATPAPPLPALVFPKNQVAAIVFTSGSTGFPRPNIKTWGSMVEVARRTGQRFGLAPASKVSFVATVPQQHMYGLETSIMLPLQHGGIIHADRPFFPEDLRQTLNAIPGAKALLTTPLHLRACVAEATALPMLQFIVSATAPLPFDVARCAEELWQTPVWEIYGWSEAGSIATRRTVHGASWQVLDGLALTEAEDRYALLTPYFADPIIFDDIITRETRETFIVHGRSADLINIAGKRISLGDLNHKLSNLAGVVDSAFVMPEETEGRTQRLAAFVVAPGKNEEDIFAGLRTVIDPIFLPRPLLFVDSLPRNESGKLPRERLLELLKTMQPAKNSFAATLTSAAD